MLERAPSTTQQAATNALAIRLAEATVLISFPTPEALARTPSRWRRFLASSGKADFFLEYRLRPAPRTLQDGPPYIRKNFPWGFRLESSKFFAHIDLQERRGWVEAAEASWGPLEVVIRQMLPHLLPSGVLVHGAMISHGEAAVVAFGPSGAGKSTLARLCGEAARCDELVALGVEGETVFAYSLPYWQAQPARAKLKALVQLHHGLRHQLSPLANAEAFHHLAGQILWPRGFPEALQQVFEAAVSIVTHTASYRLTFSPQPSVWTLVKGLLAGNPPSEALHGAVAL